MLNSGELEDGYLISIIVGDKLWKNYLI
jgi:hypothetical protein